NIGRQGAGDLAPVAVADQIVATVGCQRTRTVVRPELSIVVRNDAVPHDTRLAGECREAAAEKAVRIRASTHVPRDRDIVEDSKAVLRHAAGAGERRNRDVAADRRAAQIQLPEVVYTARTITAIVRDQGVMNPNLRGGADA